MTPTVDLGRSTRDGQRPDPEATVNDQDCYERADDDEYLLRLDAVRSEDDPDGLAAVPCPPRQLTHTNSVEIRLGNGVSEHGATVLDALPSGTKLVGQSLLRLPKLIQLSDGGRVRLGGLVEIHAGMLDGRALLAIRSQSVWPSS